MLKLPSIPNKEKRSTGGCMCGTRQLWHNVLLAWRDIVFSRLVPHELYITKGRLQPPRPSFRISFMPKRPRAKCLFRANYPSLCLIHHQWNSASTRPYLTPSTFSSNPRPALSTIISSVKSRLSNSTPRVVVNLVNKLRGTAARSVVSVHTCMRSRVYAEGGSSASHAIRSSVTVRDCPGRKFRV